MFSLMLNSVESLVGVGDEAVETEVGLVNLLEDSVDFKEHTGR